ncbi:MAG: PIG-L deacetylase family protein [Sedimentisphaerales bacterium]
MDNNKTVLSICAHPDDAEFFCAGALALLRAKGWQVNIATVTAGDCGSMEMSRTQTAMVRKNEGANAATILGGNYHCLDCDDVFVTYDKPTLLKVISLIRAVMPTIVFTLSPVDYSIDHEMTSKLVWSACFAAGIPNVETPGLGVCQKVPYLYYMDVLYGKDNLGNEMMPHFFVDITSVISVKEKMLECHESQRNWLKAYHGWDEYVEIMRRHCGKRGRQCGVQFAEGFRQHVGNAFPQDNILLSELPEFICPGT